MSEPTPGALSTGQVFHGRYEIVRCLRAGGMGAVYECIHLKTRKHRALKVMLPQVLADITMRDRFELEARVTADIESEHIVETFDAGVDEATGAPFLVMELLRGEDLRSIVKRRGALPASEVVLLLSQAALALDKTHAAGVVHRDLKPDNLFVTTRDDGSPRLKVLDFGIAKVVADAGHTVQQTAMIGTPLYMSPEQILGEGTIGPGADIYAMGHIALTLLTGAPYWSDEQKASPALYVFLGMVMGGALEPATVRAARRGVALPAAFDAWFARATARAAKDRFEGASALVQALAGVLGVAAPRSGSVPFLESGLQGAEASVVESAAPVAEVATPVAEPALVTGPLGRSAPTVSEGTTLIASSKVEGKTASRRSWVLWAAVVAGAIGLLVVGMQKRMSPLPVSPAVTIALIASSPPAVRSAPELEPSAAPVVSSSAVVPVVSAVVAPAVTAAPRVPGPLRPKLVPAKPVAPATDCEPPYVTDSSGHRAMKPQCL